MEALHTVRPASPKHPHDCAKEGTADYVVAFGIGNPAMRLDHTDDLFHTIKGVTAK